MFLICKVLLINEVAEQEREIPMTNKHTKSGQPYSEERKWNQNQARPFFLNLAKIVKFHNVQYWWEYRGRATHSQVWREWQVQLRCLWGVVGQWFSRITSWVLKTQIPRASHPRYHCINPHIMKGSILNFPMRLDWWTSPEGQPISTSLKCA